MKVAWLTLAKGGAIEKMSSAQKYGKRHQISFRITELAWERLQEVAKLFGLSEPHYVKAMLYRELGLFSQPIDRRKRSYRRRRRRELDEMDRQEEENVRRLTEVPRADEE